MKCDECRYGLAEDYGYSNYTVEGTYFYCLKNLHPNDGFDMWYGEDTNLNYAQKCSSFSKGNNVRVDVDKEETWDSSEEGLAVYSSDPEIKELLKTR